MVGLPLHNIPSPFLSFKDIFSVDLSSTISVSTLSNHVFLGLSWSFLVFLGLSWSSNQSSAFNSILQTFLHPILITFIHHMSIPSQSTTYNDSCDRLNSNQLSQCFTCPVLWKHHGCDMLSKHDIEIGTN